MAASFDLAIIGSGFAGTLLARALRARGQRVLVLERGHHPRFALGESTTPLAGFALERLAHRYGLADLRALSTHGRWLAGLPHLRRGLKRGFTFYQHHRDEPYRNSTENDHRLLVAASPDDHLADTHWLRQDVDHHLVRRALAEGVDLRQGTEVLAVVSESSEFALHLRGDDGRETIRARVVVDASGPAGVLPRSFDLEHLEPRLSSGLLFGHFAEVPSFVELARETANLGPGPYADENAAVHHLLDIGWLYALPFDHGVVSAGLVLRNDRPMPRGLTAEQLAAEPHAAWCELLAPFPTLARQLANARPLEGVRYQPRIQHRFGRAAGRGWFLLPHTFAFFDPLFSTGIAWSLLAVERLADLLAGGWGSWREYDRLLRREAEQIERLISCAYQAIGDFRLFRAVSFLYFATVSFQEVRQRIFEPGPNSPPFAWEGFLGAGEPRLRQLFHETLEHLRAPNGSNEATARWIEEQIAPWNIAGLADPTRHNLYPLDLAGLVDRSHLLGLTRKDLMAALPRLRGDEEPALTAT